LFLDEIGDIDARVQVKLLKLLEDRTVRRLGSVREQKANIRIVTATNRDLELAVREGAFRSDLLFRLRIVHFELPPLRARERDVILLGEHYLGLHRRRYRKPELRFSAEAALAMLRYTWPGNVRELRNVVERLVLMHPGPEVLPEVLPEQVRLGAVSLRPAEESEEVVIRSERVVPLAELEKAGIRDALAKLHGNKTRAAELLGISRQTLRTKVREYALESSDTEE
jgi:DNA-binding NtrC family response regulator